MKEVTKTIKVFTFDELSEEAKEYAINKELEYSLEYDWWQWIFEDLQERCTEYGVCFKTSDIHFSLGRGGYLFVDSDKIQFDWYSDIELPLKFGAYQNYNGGGMNGEIQIELVDKKRIIELDTAEEIDLILFRINKTLAIFKDTLGDLWSEYHEIQSEKYLINLIKENDLEFTEDGKEYIE